MAVTDDGAHCGAIACRQPALPGRYNHAMLASLPAFPAEISADSPCIGHCATVPGDDVCRSCQRSFDEITRWVEMDVAARRAVNLRIATLQTTGFPPARE
ncbi:MAG: DUF1289 domain-containing protein [Sideroxydans sp.]|jgi:hypothetical protein